LDYRKDARPTCSSCGRAFLVDELAPDERGGLRCETCGTTANAADYEQRAGASSARDRRGRRLIALAVGGLVLVGGAAFTVSTRREDARNAAITEANVRARLRLEPARIALGSFQERGTSACNDDALRLRAAPMGEPWTTGARLGGVDFRWDSGLFSARMLRPTSAVESRSSIALVDQAHFVIVLAGGSDSFTHWRGELVVVDVASGRPLCWAPLEVDGERGHFVVDGGKLRDAAAESLATITKAIAVAE
jgi:hypothetical protein